MVFAARLRRLRVERGLSQRALAGLIGVGPPVVRRIEGGVGNPSLAVLVSVARALDVSLGYLLGKRGKRE
jgi:transcriptional regulator with XRE-family HTH domain